MSIFSQSLNIFALIISIIFVAGYLIYMICYRKSSFLTITGLFLYILIASLVFYFFVLKNVQVLNFMWIGVKTIYLWFAVLLFDLLTVYLIILRIKASILAKKTGTVQKHSQFWLVYVVSILVFFGFSYSFIFDFKKTDAKEMVSEDISVMESLPFQQTNQSAQQIQETTQSKTSETFQATSVIYPISGNWKVVEVYSDGTTRESVYLFEGDNEKGKVTNGINYEGNYVISYNIIVEPSYADNRMEGVFIDQDNIKGEILSQSNGRKCGDWTAVCDNSVYIDMRGDWRLVQTNANNTWETSVNFGSGPSNSVIPSMINGNCKIEGSYYFKYSVKDGILFLENNGTNRPMKYEGIIIDQDKIEGEFYEYGKQAATFLLVRKKD